MKCCPWRSYVACLQTDWNIYLAIYINIKLCTAGQEHWSTRRTFFQVPWHRGLPIACQWRVWFLKQYFENVTYTKSKPKTILIYKITHWSSFLKRKIVIIHGVLKFIVNWILKNDHKPSFSLDSIKTSYQLYLLRTPCVQSSLKSLYLFLSLDLSIKRYIKGNGFLFHVYLN